MRKKQQYSRHSSCESDVSLRGPSFGSGGHAAGREELKTITADERKVPYQVPRVFVPTAEEAQPLQAPHRHLICIFTRELCTCKSSTVPHSLYRSSFVSHRCCFCITTSHLQLQPLLACPKHRFLMKLCHAETINPHRKPSNYFSRTFIDDFKMMLPLLSFSFAFIRNKSIKNILDIH